MTDSATRSPAQPAIVLGLTFLVVGLTFALPFRLIATRDGRPAAESMSPETVNVYACVAWAGWAHFIYAFRGQGIALERMQGAFREGRLFLYVAAIAFTTLAILGARWVIGPSTFSALVWVYFIDHFLKAERFFEGKSRANKSAVARWLTSYQPILTFGWLSIVLMNVGNINSISWAIWGISLMLGVIILTFGGWQRLSSGDTRDPLISLFFVAEALVWGTFSHYGGPVFLTGVYVFHIAAASYFHYFGSYFVAAYRQKTNDFLLKPVAVVGVNLLLIALGYMVGTNETLWWATPILGIQWFTVWVALHLVMSDLFPAIKRWKASAA